MSSRRRVSSATCSGPERQVSEAAKAAAARPDVQGPALARVKHKNDLDALSQGFVVQPTP